MRKKLANQVPVELIEILANRQEWNLLVADQPNRQIVQAAQRFARSNLQLLEAGGMRFRITLFRVERIRAVLRVIHELLQRFKSVRVITRGDLFRHGLEIRTAKLHHHLRSPQRVRLLIEFRLQ